MTLGDLDAAMKTATAMGQSKIHVHIFVLAALLSKCREAVEDMTELPIDETSGNTKESDDERTLNAYA